MAPGADKAALTFTWRRRTRRLCVQRFPKPPGTWMLMRRNGRRPERFGNQGGPATLGHCAVVNPLTQAKVMCKVHEAFCETGKSPNPRIAWDHSVDHRAADAVPQSAPTTYGADAQLPVPEVKGLLAE